MADGEMIVYDNTRLLHGRTDFQDPLRHLVRVRMHEREPAEALRLAS
ncbi:MAG TPA: TauD/TfdA family dioxygenase [Acetobacteraceae bacterium]|jgi:alpha-ketoglutarate-dependent taurine dioxygenase|nr:TauD/TfdA family dioxygenase [Acetobacteraceae bacterium]